MSDIKHDFSVEATPDRRIQRSELPTEYLVLFFYPKASTPGCTNEAKDFTSMLSDFETLNATVLGASRDGLRAQENFRSKHDLAMDLISDKDEALCQQFDVIKEKNMYGRKVMGIERSTFIIRVGDGEILESWRKVKVKGHAEAVLTRLREIDQRRVT